jgi:hypothetical protein
MFACAAEYSDGTFKTASMDILFIGTNTSGYGIDENEVRYLALNRGSGGQTVFEGSDSTVKVALLNLGQSADWQGGNVYNSNNNAGDLGDFYQWGRFADGHQNIVWSKNETDHKNQILPFGTTPDNTSDVIDYNNGGTIPTYDSNHQVEAGSNHYGKFIFTDAFASNGNDWYYDNGQHDNGLWGTAYGYDRAAQGTLTFDWDKPANNPCPSGWRIPSSWNYWDIVNGTGSDTSISEIDWDAADTNNNWKLRNASNNANGGVIITNSANEKIFLPIIGLRIFTTGSLGTFDFGSYWNCMFTDNLVFLNSNIPITLTRGGLKANGQCVRCVEEPEN